MPKTKPSETYEQVETDEWLCGYAVALANVARLHKDHQTVRDVLKADGLTLAKLKQAGVPEYDLRALRGQR
jgi:hypothetical protein